MNFARLLYVKTSSLAESQVFAIGPAKSNQINLSEIRCLKRNIFLQEGLYIWLILLVFLFLFIFIMFGHGPLCSVLLCYADHLSLTDFSWRWMTKTTLKRSVTELWTCTSSARVVTASKWKSCCVCGRTARAREWRPPQRPSNWAAKNFKSPCWIWCRCALCWSGSRLIPANWSPAYSFRAVRPNTKSSKVWRNAAVSNFSRRPCATRLPPPPHLRARAPSAKWRKWKARNPFQRRRRAVNLCTAPGSLRRPGRRRAQRKRRSAKRPSAEWTIKAA